MQCFPTHAAFLGGGKDKASIFFCHAVSFLKVLTGDRGITCIIETMAPYEKRKWMTGIVFLPLFVWECCHV